MRSVALILGNLDEGAFRNVALALSKGFVSAGISVDVAYLKGDAASFRDALDPRATSTKLPARRSLLSVHAVERYLKDQAPDVAVTVGALQNLPGVLAARRARYRGLLVLTEHGYMSHEAGVEHRDKLLFRGMPHLARRLYPRAGALVAVDQGILDDLTGTVKVDLARLETAVIPNPVDLDLVRASAGAAGDRAAGRAPVIVTVGRLSPQKNQELLLRAFARLAPGARLEIVGDGPERGALEAAAARLGIAGAVTFHGRRPNPHAITARADVFVLPSRIEGCPLALVEALAIGCPAVATDCAPGPRSILEDGRVGMLVPPDDPAALAGALEELLADAALRADMSRRARARAEAFGIPAVTERWLEFLARAGAGGPR